MGGDQSNHADYANQEFQSTPPYGGRPRGTGASLGKSSVSIHAPVWGATVVHVINTL